MRKGSKRINTCILKHIEYATIDTQVNSKCVSYYRGFYINVHSISEIITDLHGYVCFSGYISLVIMIITNEAIR